MKDQLTFLILARGGSKRLKNKNIKKFFGKPLLHWTIVQAVRVAKKNKVILSTEDNKIKVLGTEGTESNEWILIDVGDVLVNIMTEDSRDHYDLESLWNRAKSD